MNEQIKKLDTAAQEYAGRIAGNDEDSNYTEWFNIYKEKFAELIVCECTRVVNDTEYPYEDESHEGTWDTCCVWSAEKLKEHFGVENE